MSGFAGKNTQVLKDIGAAIVDAAYLNIRVRLCIAATTLQRESRLPDAGVAGDQG